MEVWWLRRRSSSRRAVCVLRRIARSSPSPAAAHLDLEVLLLEEVKATAVESLPPTPACAVAIASAQQNRALARRIPKRPPSLPSVIPPHKHTPQKHKNGEKWCLFEK